LPVTFYKNVADLPDFEDYSMENRTYRYFKGDVLYPFGFGLSYTTFKYENLEIPASPKANADMEVKVNVFNTGKMDGEEVVQLYISHKNASGRTPVRALKGFRRIHLKAGESKTVVFTVKAKDLAIFGSDGKQLSAKGNVEISVGGGQTTAKLISEGKAVLKSLNF